MKGAAERYQVWGTDQVAARALFSLAFMERMLALAERPGFDPPLALARDNRLTVTMPKTRRKDLFEPPIYLQTAASGEALVQLDKDIAYGTWGLASPLLLWRVRRLRDARRFWAAGVEDPPGSLLTADRRHLSC